MSLLDFVELIIQATRIERRRLMKAPSLVVSEARARGRSCKCRQPAARRRLQLLICLLDRCFPSGPNCYRRALIEIAVDAGAAAEPVHFGLKSHGGPQSGHAWLASDRSAVTRYDAEFVL